MHILRFNEKADTKEYDYDRIKKDFDDVVATLHDIIDDHEGVSLSFNTACGRRVYMKYDDYIEKNSKYDEFIKAFPILGEFFTIHISSKCDINASINYDNSLKIAKTMETIIKKIIYLDWTFKKFELSGSSDPIFLNTLNYEFTRRETPLGRKPAMRPPH